MCCLGECENQEEKEIEVTTKNTYFRIVNIEGTRVFVARIWCEHKKELYEM